MDRFIYLIALKKQAVALYIWQILKGKIHQKINIQSCHHADGKVKRSFVKAT